MVVCRLRSKSEKPGPAGVWGGATPQYFFKKNKKSPNFIEAFFGGIL
jgi:hypothetical protein